MIKHAEGDYKGIQDLLLAWGNTHGEEIVNLSIWMVNDTTWKARVVSRKVVANAKAKRARSIQDVMGKSGKRTKTEQKLKGFKINRNS